MSDLPCRICKSPKTRCAGLVEYISGYRWEVLDCPRCGCRFTRHDDRIYEAFHATGAISYYSDYRTLADTCQGYFNAGDLESLRKVLGDTSKYRHVIEAIDREPAESRILEIGCSRGYLTSYGILAGRRIIGVDVSQEAISAARRAFGNHFAVAGSPEANFGPVNDLIYHVGMIGCVADPVGLTRRFLSLLKPGGRLIFNAPNRDACHLRQQLWVDTAPPPDVVTLFPPGFWEHQVSDLAEVHETIERLPSSESLRIAYRQRIGRTWRSPTPKPLQGGGTRGHSWSQSPTGMTALAERVALKAARTLGLDRHCTPRPTDFGLFVELIRRPLA